MKRKTKPNPLRHTYVDIAKVCEKHQISDLDPDFHTRDNTRALLVDKATIDDIKQEALQQPCKQLPKRLFTPQAREMGIIRNMPERPNTDSPQIISDFLEDYPSPEAVQKEFWEILIAAMGSEHADMWDGKQRANKLFFYEQLGEFLGEVYRQWGLTAR